MRSRQKRCFISVVIGMSVLIVGACSEQELAVVPCADLAGFEPDDAVISVAENVEAGDAGPAHCRVAGVIETEINFELLLPLQWNGRFMMGGGGGYVGSIQNSALAYGAGGGALERGYATVGTDTGHVGDALDGDWALDNPERQENFGHRAVHLTAVTAKAIIERHYARPPEYSYFVGCSRGGGQAMMETQRYPEDFDGLVAGAPAYHWTGFTAGFLQSRQKMYPGGDVSRRAITQANLELLGTNILAACDALDGVEDGILTDPRTCPFRPTDLPHCVGAAQPDCVTAEQLAAIEAVYAPPTSNGESIFVGFPLGGEHDPGGWDTSVLGQNVAATGGRDGFSIDMYKNFVFSDPDWDYTEYDFSNWHDDVAETDSILNAVDTDLTEFKDAGGKIIFWTGWSDLAISALGTIDYFEALSAADPDAAEYSRLYMLPGMFHCAGGPAPDRADWIEAIRAWVEDDQPPQQLVSMQLDEAGNTTRTRPICPYPQVATYRGYGDTNVERSFTCAAPKPPPAVEPTH